MMYKIKTTLEAVTEMPAESLEEAIENTKVLFMNYLSEIDEENINVELLEEIDNDFDENLLIDDDKLFEER